MYSSLLLFVIMLLTVGFILWRRRSHYASYKLKGPKDIPFIGNLLNLPTNPQGKIEIIKSAKSIFLHRNFGEIGRRKKKIRFSIWSLVWYEVVRVHIESGRF